MGGWQFDVEYRRSYEPPPNQGGDGPASFRCFIGYAAALVPTAFDRLGVASARGGHTSAPGDAATAAAFPSMVAAWTLRRTAWARPQGALVLAAFAD